MKRSISILIGFFILVVLVSLLVQRGRVANAITETKANLQGEAPKSPQAPKVVDNFAFDSKTVNKPAHPAAKTNPEQARRQELQSLKDMSKTLFVATQTPRKMKELIEFLRVTRQEPVVSRDSNADTGDMIIVRTKSPFPGTRYFHAQYFADNGKEPFVQHMSFEYKPGPKAFDDAQKAVSSAFPKLGKPTIKNRDFIQWPAENGYVVWIKRMGRRDLEDDPFNAYTPNDIGTIRIAIELDINHH